MIYIENVNVIIRRIYKTLKYVWGENRKGIHRRKCRFSFKKNVWKPRIYVKRKDGITYIEENVNGIKEKMNRAIITDVWWKQNEYLT